MRVTATDNLSTVFKGGKQVIGDLKVPVIGLKMGLPIGFDAKIQGDMDVVNEGELIAAAEAEIKRMTSSLAAELSKALEDALKASVWSWTGGTRDIYDTGELARSGSVTATGDGITVVYSAPYANIVHNGGYIYPYGNKGARPIYLPPRPWVTSVLYGGGPVPQFDFEDFFARNLR